MTRVCVGSFGAVKDALCLFWFIVVLLIEMFLLEVFRVFVIFIILVVLFLMKLFVFVFKVL